MLLDTVLWVASVLLTIAAVVGLACAVKATVTSGGKPTKQSWKILGWAYIMLIAAIIIGFMR